MSDNKTENIFAWIERTQIGAKVARQHPGLIEELSEAAREGNLTKEEIIESLKAGVIKRDSDLTIN